MAATVGRSGGNPLEQLTLDDLRRRRSIKWTHHPADVLPLWVAEMDVPLAEPVAVRLHAAITDGDTGYPGGQEYAEALSAFAADRWSWPDLDIDSTALVPDVMVGIVEVLRLITQPGDPVIVCPPVYPPFYAFVSHAGRFVVEAPLAANGRLDLEALAEAFAVCARRPRGSTVLLLCNPHNPTGVVHTRAELTALAGLAREHGVRVIADEVHGPLVLDGAEFVPYLTVPGTEDAFAIHSASKAWNLAAFKAALVVAGPDAAAELAQLPEEISHLPSHLGVLSHAAALRDGRDWLDELRAGLVLNRARLAALAAELLPDLPLARPEATYLGWLDCRALGLHHGLPARGVTTELVGPARVFLDRARVALTSGHAFGRGGAGFVRINYATNAAVLDEAVRRMAAATEQLRSLALPSSATS